MSKPRYDQKFDLGLLLRKWMLSGFVIFTFIAYAIHERLTQAGTADNPALPAQSQSDPTQAQTSGQGAPDASQPSQSQPQDQSQPQPQPTNAPAFSLLPAAPTPAPATGSYRDGTYTGDTADALYGLVQVQATVQGGKITNVQFLRYPNDRRTSVFINSQAMPWLTQEAIQAQSANVDLISGATLTSEAFIESLQVALSSARS